VNVFYILQPNPFGTTGTFGQTAPAFGQTSSATTGFGAFGAKPTTGFGAITTSASTGTFLSYSCNMLYSKL